MRRAITVKIKIPTFFIIFLIRFNGGKVMKQANGLQIIFIHKIHVLRTNVHHFV